MRSWLTRPVLYFIGLLVIAGLGIGIMTGITTPFWARTTTVWVPDNPGRKVYQYTIPAFPDWAPYGGPTFSQNTVDVSANNCTPNSVVLRYNTLYIACTSFFTSGTDQILVYNTMTKTFGRTITGVGTDGNNYFSGLIALVVDPYNNLWVSSFNNNLLLRVSSGSSSGNLDSSDPPLIDRSVYNSPGSPAGIAIDPSDGSLWIVGQFDNGIVVSFPTTNDPAASGYINSVNQQGGPFLGNGQTGSALGPSLNPVFCISATAGDCPQQQTAAFNNAEGIAVFDNAVWVSNNGGNQPTGTMFKLTKAGTNTLSVAVSGGTVGAPFSCPGGLFSTATARYAGSLWVNDEAFGRGGAGQPQTACGASGGIAGDQGSQVGRVIEFLAADLDTQPAHPTPEQFDNWKKVATSSPGFGGIFVSPPSLFCLFSLKPNPAC